MDIKQQFLEAAKFIESYERDFVLICMGMRMYEMSINDDIKGWEKSCLALKLKLFASLRPEHSACTLAIYGQQAEVMFHFYQKLFEHKEHIFEAKTLWYRESYFTELILPVPDEDGTVHTQKIPRQEYVKLTYDTSKSKNLTPEEKDDKFVGIEVKLWGDAIYMYWEEERGLHRWKVDDKNFLKFVVEVTPDVAKTPINIHRKKFFENRVIRRTIEPGYLTDNMYDIKREVQKQEHADFILEALDKRFNRKLDSELL